MRVMVTSGSCIERQFPIPMRGNEMSLTRRTARAQLFPIPMRGNEHNVRIVVRHTAEVSDPHEG